MLAKTRASTSKKVLFSKRASRLYAVHAFPSSKGKRMERGREKQQTKEHESMSERKSWACKLSATSQNESGKLGSNKRPRSKLDER
jgi:hypothetical protein